MQRSGALEVALAVVREREGARRRDRVVLVAGPAEESQALLGELLRLFEVCFLDRDDAEHVEVLSSAPQVTKAAMKLERLLGDRPGRRNISAPVRHEGRFRSEPWHGPRSDAHRLGARSRDDACPR